MNQSLPLLAELDLGSARGGKAGINRAPLAVSVVRPLGEADLPAIANPPPVSAGIPALKSIRHSHHRLAQLVAEGKPGVEIAFTTGYSQSYISNLQGDPAFEELVAYYAEMRKEVFVDAQERLRLLGLDATEKLHEQLLDPNATWSHRELMEVIEMALPEAKSKGKGEAQAPQGGGHLQLEVKFVGAQPIEGKTIETSYTDVTPKDP